MSASASASAAPSQKDVDQIELKVRQLVPEYGRIYQSCGSHLGKDLSLSPSTFSESANIPTERDSTNL